QLVQSETTVAVTLVAVYKSLGGGWPSTHGGRVRPTGTAGGAPTGGGGPGERSPPGPPQTPPPRQGREGEGGRPPDSQRPGGEVGQAEKTTRDEDGRGQGGDSQRGDQRKRQRRLVDGRLKEQREQRQHARMSVAGAIESDLLCRQARRRGRAVTSAAERAEDG